MNVISPIAGRAAPAAERSLIHIRRYEVSPQVCDLNMNILGLDRREKNISAKARKIQGATEDQYGDSNTD